jgi:hypothetical protein
MNEAPGIEMPRYKSHKTVWALEIAAVSRYGDSEGDRWLEFADRGYAGMAAPAEMFARYMPIPGDFYVQYADGYKSFSPRKAFLEGYTKL